MSFSARLPPSRGSGRPRGGDRARYAAGAAAKTEDAQPNELLSKRSVAAPPVIRTSAPIPRSRGARGGRSRGAPSVPRGRGGPPPVLPTPRASIGDGSYHGHAGRAPSGTWGGPSRPGAEFGTSGRKDQDSVQTHPYPTPRRSYGPYQQRDLPGPSGTLHRAERSNNANPHEPSGVEYESLSAILNQKHALDAAAASGLAPNSRGWSDPDRTAVPPRTLPPRPRGHLPFSNLREAPPHLNGSSRDRAFAPIVREPERVISASGRSAMPSLPSTGDGSAPSTNAASGSRPYPRPVIPVKPLVSASDLHLSDLSNPAASARTVRGDLPPPSKRRRVSPPSTSRTQSSSLARDTPSARPDVPSPATSRSSSVSQPLAAQAEATTAIPQGVKRERSPSPVIDASSPHLVTEGCVRIAPLPTECQTGRPGFKAARKAWTAQEVKKLRDRGVQPTRGFVREDGLVIDWKSKVPVMSDTLRPPTVASVPAGVAALPPRPDPSSSKKQEQPVTSTGGEATTSLHTPESEGAAVQPDPTSSTASQRPARSIRWKNIPAPGETIWERVLPPARPVPAAPQQDNAASNARSGQSSPVVEPATTSLSAADVIDLTEGDMTEVDIIDLTEEPHGQPEGHAELSLSPTPPQSTPSPEPAVNRETEPRAPEGEDEMQAAALHFLQRYVAAFATDRADLASAYSRAATFSAHVLPLPTASRDAAAKTSPAHHRGRLDIIAALLDLPDEELPPESWKIEWDLIYAREAGDILLVCYTTSSMPVRGKGKRRANTGPHGLCEQRFILRPQEWDEEDRSTPGVWPLVAVAHQMLFRPLPP